MGTTTTGTTTVERAGQAVVTVRTRADTRPSGVPRGAVSGSDGSVDEVSNHSIPVLVGGLSVGESNGLRWAVWPWEVYPTGCLIQTRLDPTGPRPRYDMERMGATFTPRPGHENDLIQLRTSDDHELLCVQVGNLPPYDGVARGFQPWDLTWTLSWWWPRPDWRQVETLVLAWPAHALRVDIPVDQRAIRLVAGPPVAAPVAVPPPTPPEPGTESPARLRGSWPGP